MKAILVIDINEKHIGAIGTEIQFFNRKYKNCKWEIKPLPQRKNTSKIQDFGNAQIVWTDKEICQNEGWNACLDAITGETE